MKISTKARYGTRLMLELGLYYEQGPLLLKDIARLEEISEKYLSQIVIPLRNAGLVNSFRGAHGGYVLAKPPAQISMREVVEALEGELILVDCLRSSELCGRTALCVTRSMWKKMSKKMIEAIEELTLADLVDECKTKNCKSIHRLAPNAFTPSPGINTATKRTSVTRSIGTDSFFHTVYETFDMTNNTAIPKTIHFNCSRTK